MNLTGLKVNAIAYPHAEYRLSSPVVVVDEGSFYRIDGTHIIDKHKIREVHRTDDKVEVVMTDQTVSLELKE